MRLKVFLTLALEFGNFVDIEVFLRLNFWVHNLSVRRRFKRALFYAGFLVSIFLLGGGVRIRLSKRLLLKLFYFLVLLDSTLILVLAFLDLLSEFLFDGRDC